MSEGVRYTRERLIEAAAKCSDIEEVIAFFGTRPYGRLRQYLWRRFAHYGIDVSHLHRRGYRRSGPRPTAAELARAVAGSISLAETLRRLGRPESSSQKESLKQWIAEDRLSTAHFLGQAHQAAKPGTNPPRKAVDLLVKHDGKYRTKSAHLRRALSEIGVPERCTMCGTEPAWLGKPMTLEVDHIDGDWSDDRAENLRLLCPNCHAVTDTWCRGGRRRTPQANAG
ncbi:HNH endonuclease signature motif containing protein [Streptomyces sp. P9(2023)]|uniref:HNH endonuclease signature motif containing protein n=1 Tax=Streptomyces sp. P9(2023) TaxID=3064394 RepID=UPI0028F424B3|nr:HNH endonuclease signature motif containing protein [Streptomyces sp. P9(2023)]MDT9689268.1 HNH endonuclease signature motif containing protein [Streptomyces sp. P9(2023)]